MTFVDCGHPGILHFSARGRSSRILKGSNFPLGVLEDAHYDEVHESFEPGDLFLLYSDGLIEARALGGGMFLERDMFGVERLQKVVEALENTDPPAVITALRRALRDHVGTEDLDDDFTMVAIQIHSSPGTRLEPLIERKDTFRRDMTELRRARKVLAEFSVETLNDRADEAYINDHVPTGSDESPIKLDLSGFADRVSLRVSYEGPVFQPVSVGLPSQAERMERGRGLFIISQTVDTIRYVAEAGVNYVEINKFPANFPLPMV